MAQFVDVYYAGDKKNHSSHSGILIYLNRAPIIWYINNQKNVEMITSGSKIIAFQTGLGITKGLRYKPRMMGVPIGGPKLVFWHNKLVVTSTSVQQWTLGKKNLDILYHAVR